VADKKILYVFPGQGSQYRGMGSDLVEAFPVARDLYARASEVVGYDMTELSFRDPREQLNQTRFTQPALLTHEVAWARKLRSLVGDRTVTCTKRDVDNYGRIVAVCRSGALDLNAEMVRSGFATAYRRYSGDYVDEENQARKAHRGIWAGEFTNPEVYRHDDAPAPRSSDGAASVQCEGCYIKGNINAKGERIYHVPGSPSYDETVVDESKGERWFRSESEARAAGWRAPRG